MNLTILQWNIWYREDIRNIAQFLKGHPADIICLQELTIRSAPEIGYGPHYIAEQLGYNQYHKEINLGDGKINLANGIFTRFPITQRHFAWINEPQSTGGYDDEYRAYVEVVVDVEGKRIRIGTAHMSYTHQFEPTERKREETDRLMAQLARKDGPLVFTGDLNASPDSYTIHAVANTLNNMGPGYEERTWATKPFSYGGFEETELAWRLDYIFATPDVKPLKAEILRTEYSDHLPVWAKLDI
ncbi:MAG TPA: endonuclease/exonuclease/phosphatase family protein [Verrucomicrobiae bacterium]|nr:endonuclease/exonuclease/phosphatase family protein [Verrucomicrobiae bacterium]